MNDTYVYVVELPEGVNEAVTPCPGGYTVYINACLTMEEQQKAFDHAMRHITNDDFSKDDVQSIETDAHRRAG